MDDRKNSIYEPINIIAPETVAAEMCRLRMDHVFDELYRVIQKERSRGNVEKNAFEFKRKVFEVFIQADDANSACHELTIEKTPFFLRRRLFEYFRKNEMFKRLFCQTFQQMIHIQPLMIDMVEAFSDREYAGMLLDHSASEENYERLCKIIDGMAS